VIGSLKMLSHLKTASRQYFHGLVLGRALKGYCLGLSHGLALTVLVSPVSTRSLFGRQVLLP